jgi:hypothetical protein
MSKRISITQADLEERRELLLASAEQTQIQMAELAGVEDPIQFLFRLKFEEVGCDPLNCSRPLNLIEQLNQTFTYLASFSGAEFLFERHPEVKRLDLNLGTSGGSDIETTEGEGIAAEVFAAVTPRNNGKLAADINKVSKSSAKYRYVLFMSPKHEAGPYKCKLNDPRVIVWSLGSSL